MIADVNLLPGAINITRVSKITAMTIAIVWVEEIAFMNLLIATCSTEPSEILTISIFSGFSSSGHCCLLG